MFFVYKFFTWFVLIVTTLFGATIAGFIVGAAAMAWIDDETRKTKHSEYRVS